MDKIRQKAQSLLEKLHDKYGVQSKHHIHVVVATMGKKDGEGTELQDHWYLVDAHGQKFRLPRSTLFMGREECDVVVSAQSVDKRHAVLAYDLCLNQFKLKDLGTANGTFVNNSRIPEQEYVTLNHMDSVRLGQDAMMYHMEQGSQITRHGGQLPDPHFIPSWASRAQDPSTIHVHAHALAECQGCIAEQNIEHTCGLKLDSKSNDGSVQVHEHQEHSHQHHPHHDLNRGHQCTAQQPSQTPSRLSQDDQQHQHFDQSSAQQLKDDEAADASRHQSLQEGDHAGVAKDDASGDCSGAPSQSRNTWPFKRQLRQMPHVDSIFQPDVADNQDDAAGEPPSAGTMFFVAFDDSVCGANSSSSAVDQGRLQHKSNTELAQVKKETWRGSTDSNKGDTSSTGSLLTLDGESKDARESSQPCRFALNTEKTCDSPVSRSAAMESEHVKPAYMEIPLRDEKPTKGADKSKDNTSASKTKSPSAEINPATSFTVDLSDSEHMPNKHLDIGSSISAYVPSKMKKHFKDRKALSSNTFSKETTSAKNSEERELSPLSQERIDEIWSKVEARGKSKLSGIQSTPAAAPKSPHLQDMNPQTEERRSLDKDSEKRGSLRKPLVSGSPKLSTSSKVVSSYTGSVTNTGSPTSVANSFSISKYPDTASYLFEKMFEGGASLSHRTDKPHSPESQQDSRDKPALLRHSTEKALVRPVIDSTSTEADHDGSLGVKNSLQKASNKTILHSSYECDDDLKITEDVLVADEKEDKTSEAGTYTIEADVKEGQDAEEEARKKIPEVFGVDVDSFNIERPVIDSLGLIEFGSHRDVIDDGEDTLLDESSHSPGDDDTDVHLGDDSDDENSDMAATEDTNVWVSQRTTVSHQKSHDSSRTAKIEVEASLSKKPPQGISKTRPGTGRKLPSIPPVNSGFSPGHQILPRKIPDSSVNDKHFIDSTLKSAVGLDQAHSKTVRNGYPGSPASSKMLHQDHAFTPLKYGSAKKNSQHSDADMPRTGTVVNGDEVFAVPALYKSPRDYLEKKQQKELIRSSSGAGIPSTSVGKKPFVKSASQAAHVPKTATSPRSTPSASGSRSSDVSDVHSRKDSIDNDSIMSDHGSDTSSKGKSTLTKARPNRTFELRRARAGSLDGPPAPRSAKSSAMSKSSHSSSISKSNSLSSSTRNRPLLDTGRSETMMVGAQTARRSLNISREEVSKTSKAVSSRVDSGLHGQNLQRASSLTISHPIFGSKRELTPKLHLRSTPTGKSKPTLTGFGSVINRSQSQPNSRSSSPRSAEKIAWERRKGYDARKSVAEAKAHKTKDAPQTSTSIIRAKPVTKSSITRNMIKSASFTNSAGLSTSLRTSASISQDFSDPGNSHHQLEDPHKAFIPIHSSRHNGRSPHSADEYDTLHTSHSAQDNTMSSMLLLETPSAFTPPLLRNKSVTPEAPSPSEPFLSLRRRIRNMDGDSSPSLVKSPHANGDSGYVGLCAAQSFPQASYDTLIVTSVYQLSQKLRTSMDKALNKLRGQNRITQTPSPADEFSNESGRNEIKAWKAANHELSGTLKNLRTLERHMQMMHTALFPKVDVDSEVSAEAPASRQVKQKLLEDMERKYGFHPIDQPIPHPQMEENEIASPEMEELSGQFS